MKVLWAIDAFDKDPASRKAMANLLTKLGLNRRSDQVEALYVASPSEPELSLAYDVSATDRYTKYPEKILKKSLQGQEVGRLGVKPVVIREKSPSIRKATDQLLKYAQEKKFDLIALQTHGREGFKRFLMGSFAEGLVHRARISLLVTNPEVKPSGPITRILFAVDMGKTTKKALEEVTEFAKRSGAAVIVYHVPHPSYGVHFKGQDPEVETYRKSVRKKLKALGDYVTSQGVVCETVLDAEMAPVTDLISRQVKKKKVDLVAVSAHTGSLGALFLGSVSRSLIRSSRIPVLVIRV